MRPVKLAEIAALQQERLGLTAAAGPPLVPPREWFEMEEPDEPTGWTVTADGQVFGHAAVWGTCHTGKPGKCITPPKSRSGYAFYRTGTTETADGELIPTGRITLGTGHASLTASPHAAAEHYDNTGAVVADVVVKDGRHGIWVSGSLRPNVSPERIRELRGASLSGDWRSIRGSLEMLGLLAVNVPGFPVPRALALTASGDDRQELYADALAGGEELLALVAAGVLTSEIADQVTDEAFNAEFEALYASCMDKGKRKGAQTAAELNEQLTAAAPANKDKVAKVMAEFKEGKLRSSDGTLVTDKKQALAIALSEAREDEEEDEEITAAGRFDASKHPRHPKGRREGGRFAAKGTAELKQEWLEGEQTDELRAELKDRGYGGWARDRESGVGPEVDPERARSRAEAKAEERIASEDRTTAMSRDPDADPGEYTSTPAQQEAQVENEVEESRKRLSEMMEDYGQHRGTTTADKFLSEMQRYAYLRWPEAFEGERADGRLDLDHCFECEEDDVDVNDLPAALPRAPRPDDLVAATALTASMREALAAEGLARPDGSYPIRNRTELLAAIVASAGTDAELCGWIATRADELEALGDIPAHWDLQALAAAGLYTEAKHRRHPKGVREGGRYAPKAGGHTSKLVEGPGGRMMSKTEATKLLDKERGKRVRDHMVTPSQLPPSGGVFGMYSEEGERAVEEAVEEWLHGDPDQDTDEVVANIQKRVAAEGHAEVSDTVVRERLYQEVEAYKDDFAEAVEAEDERSAELLEQMPIGWPRKVRPGTDR